MPEAIADAPETTTVTDPQRQPLTAPLNPRLQALIDKALPSDGGIKPPADEGLNLATNGENTVDAVKTDEPPVEKPKAKTEPSSDLRLAPDFSEPKPEEPKVEEIEITDEMIAAERSPKKQADMRKFRTALETLKAENARLKSAPPAKTEDPGAADIISQKDQQLAEMSAQLERLNLQAHPLFRQQLIEPRERMLGQAVDVVKEVGGDVEGFERAMTTLTGKARIAALDEIVDEIKSPILREKLGRLIDGIDTKDREIDGALKDAKGMSARLRNEEVVRNHEMLLQQEQQLKHLLGSARRQLEEGIPLKDGETLKLEVLKKVGQKGYEWWDEQVDDIDATAQEILFKATPDKMAIAAVLAASAGPLRSLWQAEQRARKAAEARLAEIEGADPGDLNGRRKAETVEEFGPDADITKVALSRLRRGDFKTAA